MYTTCGRNTRLSEQIKRLARCVLFLSALTSIAGCTVERISPGGTIDVQVGDQAYHVWWRVADGPGEQLRYYLLAKAVSGSGTTSFVLSFRDTSMHLIHQSFEAANESTAVVFEDAIPDGCTSIQLEATADSKTTNLSFAMDSPIQHVLAALRESQEVASTVTATTDEQSQALDIRVSETAQFMWGSTISLEVSVPPSASPDTDRIDLNVGYYSGFTDRLASWPADVLSFADDGSSSISTRFQTEDLAYACLHYSSGDSLFLTFHIYAPCPFSGS